MKIEKLNQQTIIKLRNSGISQEMKSLETSRWAAIEEQDNKIIGIAGIGGLFNISSVYIDKQHRNKGLGRALQTALVNEAKVHHSFIAVFIDPTNTASISLHSSLGYETIFQINYNQKITQQIMLLTFNKKGKLVKKLLSFFNTLLGITILAVILKLTTPLFPHLISYQKNEMPKPSITHIIKSFKPIHNYIIA